MRVWKRRCDKRHEPTRVVWSRQLPQQSVPDSGEWSCTVPEQGHVRQPSALFGLMLQGRELWGGVAGVGEDGTHLRGGPAAAPRPTSRYVIHFWHLSPFSSHGRQGTEEPNEKSTARAETRYAPQQQRELGRRREKWGQGDHGLLGWQRGIRNHGMYKRRGRAWLRGHFWKSADGTLSILASILGTCCRVSFVVVVPVYLGI